jgi:hypothetical protein
VLEAAGLDLTPFDEGERTDEERFASVSATLATTAWSLVDLWGEEA